jgi:hypothetical protein
MPVGLFSDKQLRTRLKVLVLGMSELTHPEQRSIAVVVVSPFQRDSKKGSTSVLTVGSFSAEITMQRSTF